MNMNKTEMIFLLDRSGSMEGLEKDTIGGFNSLIERQCRLKGETKVTAILFDDQYEVLWDGIDAEEARLTVEDYYARGMTAMLDAVGKTILDIGRRLSVMNEEEKPGKVLFVVSTDGMENASREFTYRKVKELIKHQQEKYNWEFIFMGANIDAEKEAESIGIEAESAYTFDATEEGVKHMYSMMDAELSERRKIPGR